jgi:DNA-binding IclR family transcriptional regulator
MNSLRRMLDVLGLFRPDQPVIDIEIICRQLGYTPASAYRYVKELSDAGLLVRLPRGYAVGPRVIELDRPILASSRNHVGSLVEQTGLELLISELYGSTVITIFDQMGIDKRTVRFGRGRPMDLFRSATSRVILAYLLPRQLRRLYDQHLQEATHIAPTWKDFSKAILSIRKSGYCVSRGELDQGMAGIAAPIFDEKRRILGSLTLVGSTERFNAFHESFLANLVCVAASHITADIARG